MSEIWVRLKYASPFFMECKEMELKELLEINPVLITSIGATLIGLGGRDLVLAMYNRYCKKADEADTDHELLVKLTEQMAELNDKVEKLEANARRSDTNDVMMIGRQILDLQNRAIAKEKVSSACMPDYLEAYEHYMELAEMVGCKVSERIKLNHVRILEMVKQGQVVETLKEWYK